MFRKLISQHCMSQRLFPNYKELDFKNFIDVDNTVIKPSPQRVRNILTLEEKIAVIKAYEQRPMYKKVARMFNCSWEQIKNIITNRVAIMEFYHAAKNKSKYEGDMEDDPQMDVKQRKIKFLGECVYECIQRLQYHAKLPITEELIRHKALEFLDVLRIPGFSPTKKWLNLFKATYNITLSNKQISIYTQPHFSLDIKDIMTFCTKQRTSKSLITTKYNTHDVKNEEYEAKRLRKMNFLQEALKEYLLRVKFHHKAMKLDKVALRKVAEDFNEILKVQDFEPTTEWIEDFRKQIDSNECLANAKRPPLSLDLKDILSYCSRMQNKSKDNTITLAPKGTALQMRVLPKYSGNNFPESDLKFQQSSIIYLDEEAGVRDIKPDINEIRSREVSVEQSPPLKIRKIESINNDPELHCKIPANIEVHKTPLTTTRQVAKEHSKQMPGHIVYVKKSPAVTSNHNHNVKCLTSQSSGVNIKEETFDENNYILPTNSTSPALLQQQSRLSPVQQQHPPLGSFRPADDNGSVELPRHVTSFKDALLLLKPIEEYAMLKENYRAIGLITQLETVLKNETDNNIGDEEFIG